MNPVHKPRLLIFNDFFYPAYKAGGPIQSLVNLIVHLSDTMDIFVFSSAFDLHEKRQMEVKVNQWNDILLPGAGNPVKVWYNYKGKRVKRAIINVMDEVKPSVVYINGMYSFSYVMLPILMIRKVKMVICPRGMIQTGALADKYLKKSIYLFLLKYSGFVKRVWWHATSEIERSDIKRIFGNHALVMVAGNIPKKPVTTMQAAEKKKGSLRLVYLSLITFKKNILLAIESVLRAGEGVVLDIYGPVKDVQYWSKCEPLVNSSNGKVNYLGDVKPENVQKVFAKYDAGCFLTKAENFGHALYESLSCGRPIVASKYTPWRDLEQFHAGWNVDIENPQSVVEKLDDLAKLDQIEFEVYCQGAYEHATNYYQSVISSDTYSRLFN